jgi:hypothetical protein
MMRINSLDSVQKTDTVCPPPTEKEREGRPAHEQLLVAARASAAFSELDGL